jgi:hypothetical protein
MRQRRPRQKDDGHLRFIRTLPCVICGDDTTVEAAHVRKCDPSVAKPMTGVGTKSDDKYVVPLCGQHHREQHETGDEDVFWNAHGIDPVKVGLALYAVSGDHQEGTAIAAARAY